MQIFINYKNNIYNLFLKNNECDIINQIKKKINAYNVNIYHNGKILDKTKYTSLINYDTLFVSNKNIGGNKYFPDIGILILILFLIFILLLPINFFSILALAFISEKNLKSDNILSNSNIFKTGINPDLSKPNLVNDLFILAIIFSFTLWLTYIILKISKNIRQKHEINLKEDYFGFFSFPLILLLSIILIYFFFFFFNYMAITIIGLLFCTAIIQLSILAKKKMIYFSYPSLSALIGNLIFILYKHTHNDIKYSNILLYIYYAVSYVLIFPYSYCKYITNI